MIDTTYLLPAAGIAVAGVPTDATRRVREAGHSLLASEISLFEVLAKGAKLVLEGKADPGRISLAIKSIQSDTNIGKVEPYTEGIMALAIELRRHHDDFVDCLILASAANECDVLVTEDAGITRNDNLMNALRQLEPNFKVLSLGALLTRRP